MMRKKHLSLKEGDILEARSPFFAKLKIISVEKKRIGDLSEEDVKNEGADSIQDFRSQWKNEHGDLCLDDVDG